MSESLITNLKYTLLIIGKAGTREKDCPVSSTVYGTMIDWLFGDRGNYPKIIKKYRESRVLLDDRLQEEGKSFDDVIAQGDRTIFKYIDLFPETTMKEYGAYLRWFSEYLRTRVDDRVIGIISKYITAMDSNIKRL
jgi:hypothetical protein